MTDRNGRRYIVIVHAKYGIESKNRENDTVLRTFRGRKWLPVGNRVARSNATNAKVSIIGENTLGVSVIGQGRCECARCLGRKSEAIGSRFMGTCAI